MTELLNLIKERRSVRTFNGEPVRAEDREKLEQYIETITNPFGVPVRFVLLDAEEHGLSSPVLTGETLFVAGKVDKVQHAEVAFCYSFEKLVLYAWSLGIGTTWIAGTMKREVFERAAGLAEGEMMPCISPLGYPAEKRSIRENMMRKGVGADSRLPVEKIFFDGAWDAGLTPEKQAEIADLTEMVRWAPSAVNKRNKGYITEKTGDLQKIDVGIALCHMVMGLEEQGSKPEVVVADPGLAVPAGVEYVATVRGV